MYYLEDSDQEILESPVGQEWKEEARRYWEKHLPKMSAELKAQRKFEESLDRAVVNALRTRSRVYLDLVEQPHVKNEPDFLKRAGLRHMCDLMAQEFAKKEFIYLPPEKEDD
ncbi:hypothetical protein SAMN02745218_02925 [Desulfofundulus australicus DSM 11792]|uniref:Uncharacterized protein n=1 Tax=Desulfofundulus australicus DSM 11792 TaxID=1121425 RepID=A0A1M5DUX4_9FIRM|nr:hypothetical protein [Desulfofundulus australicus]SHF70739.1 hypothetical protein SAMN02745218_02925 [Desulfofundulus australicus DSM 11792]